MVTIEYKLHKDEVILNDNYAIRKGLVYIVDGMIMRSPANGKVLDWKSSGVGEVRKCNLVVHEFAKLGDKVS